MTLSPLGVRVSPFVSGLSLLHVSPRFCTSPQPSILMIESTASRGAVVTSSACTGMSTWQLGAKHSITKRSTREPRREVGLPCMARPRRVRTPRLALSSLVARGLAGHFPKERLLARSWLKTYGCECTNPSVTWCTPGPRTGAAVPVRAREGCRPLRPAQQDPAGRGDRAEAERHRGGFPGGVPVHDQHQGNEQAAERSPAHHRARRIGGACGSGRRCAGRHRRACVAGAGCGGVRGGGVRAPPRARGPAAPAPAPGGGGGRGGAAWGGGRGGGSCGHAGANEGRGHPVTVPRQAAGRLL